MKNLVVVISLLSPIVLTAPALATQSACFSNTNRSTGMQPIEDTILKDDSGFNLYRSVVKGYGPNMSIKALSRDRYYWSFISVCELDGTVLEKGFIECQVEGDFLTAGECNYQGDFLITQPDGSVKKVNQGKPAKLPYLDANGNFETETK